DSGSTLASMILGSGGWDADCGDDCEGSAGLFCPSFNKWAFAIVAALRSGLANLENFFIWPVIST
ncbi:MAG TPA: hypothetical protein VEH07_03660, partial [Alphaproteobacteria bacterium]|nr:hypothetical protein [Alphaproteobacteria bacterium]